MGIFFRVRCLQSGQPQDHDGYVLDGTDASDDAFGRSEEQCPIEAEQGDALIPGLRGRGNSSRWTPAEFARCCSFERGERTAPPPGKGNGAGCLDYRLTFSLVGNHRKGHAGGCRACGHLKCEHENPDDDSSAGYCDGGPVVLSVTS